MTDKVETVTYETKTPVPEGMGESLEKDHPDAPAEDTDKPEKA